MTFRTFAASMALVALLASLWGCAGKSTAPEPVADESLAAGNAAFAHRDYARACQELSRAGKDAETLTKAGIACAKDGEIKSASALEAAMRADGHYAPALEALGMAAFARGDLTEARSLLMSAAKAGGKDTQAALALGRAALLTGHCPEALEAFQTAFQRDPQLSSTKSGLAVARRLCGMAKPGHSAPTAVEHPATPSLSAPTGSPAPSLGPAPAAGTKEAPKGKAAPKVIDLNDI